MMGIRSFENRGTHDINYGTPSKEASRILPKELHRKAQVKLARLGAATSIQDLRELRGNRFKVLRGDRKVNAVFRLMISTESVLSGKKRMH